MLPLLENLGLRVLEQVSYTFGLRAADLSPEERETLALGDAPVYTRGLDIFRVQDAAGQPLTVTDPLGHAKYVIVSGPGPAGSVAGLMGVKSK